MKAYFSMSNIGNVLFCSLIMCLFFQTILAGELDKNTVLETENRAKQLSSQWSGETIRRSIGLYLEAAENWEKLGEMKRASASFRESARLAQLVSDYETAFSSLNRAVKIDDNNKYPEGKVLSLSLLSLISRQKGDIEKSENYYKQALTLSEESATDPARANALFSAGMYNYFYGDIKTTLGFVENALSFANKTGDKNLIAEIQRLLGFTYARDGDPVKGLQSLQDALKMWKEAENRRGQAIAYTGIGFQYLLMGRRQIALDNFKEAEKGFPDDVDWLDKARLFNSIADVYKQYGELSLAEKYQTQALDLFKKADYPSGVLATLPSLASLKRLNGETATSKVLFDEALNLAKKLKDNFNLAIIKENFGDIDLENGDYDSAIKNYQEAFAIYKDFKFAFPRVQNSMGKAFEKKGDPELAKENYQAALETNLKTKDLAPAAENLYNLAYLNMTLGNIDKAFEYSNESIKITESLYTDVENNKLRRTFLSSIYDRYSLNIHLLMKMHERFPDKGYDLKALQASEKSRSRSLLENLRLTEAEFTADADPETVKREKELRNLLTFKADKLTQSLTSGGSEVEIKNVEDEINELRNELEQIKGELKQKSPVYSTIKNPLDFDVQEFQQNVLDKNTLLLEFSFGEKESYLWLIGKNSFDVYVLPKREDLEAGLSKIYDLLVSRQLLENESDEDYKKRIAKAENEYWKESQVLSDQLFAQVLEKLSDKRLVFVTDGKLRYFPVSALPFPNAAGTSKINEPFLLTNEVVYEPSASTLSLLSKNLKRAKSPEKDLLIFADPIYSPKDERIASNREKSSELAVNRGLSPRADLDENEQLNLLQRLPATKEEAESIEQTFGSSNSDLFSGFTANREKFFETNLSNYKVLHFATHGSLNDQHPEFSALVLSQYDENGKRENGLVRLQDIYSLNLAADLVVLSACDTGIGKEIKGEGLISLTDGFLQVGAKTVVSSRWKVGDYATLELMKNFYQIMEKESLPPSQALRKAKIKLREDPRYSSPYHWAAFTIQGDYQHKPEFSNRFNFSKYFLLIISVLVLFGIYRGIKHFK